MKNIFKTVGNAVKTFAKGHKVLMIGAGAIALTGLGIAAKALLTKDEPDLIEPEYDVQNGEEERTEDDLGPLPDEIDK